LWMRNKPEPVAAQAVTVTTPAPVAVPAQTAVVVTSPPPVIEEKPQLPPPEPPPAEGAPPPPDARTHFRFGQEALLNHDFGHASRELHIALDHGSELDDRERRLAELGIAIANGERLRAAELGREIHRLYPGDPDLERIRREFIKEPPPRPVFRRRLGRP